MNRDEVMTQIHQRLATAQAELSNGFAEPLAEILEMARRGAAAFVTTPSIFTLHAVTAPMAYLLIADHVDDDTQAIAATVFTHTHRRHLSAPLRPSDGQSAGSSDLSVLARRWDAHPAKLVEAAQRGHGLTCDVVFSMRSRP